MKRTKINKYASWIRKIKEKIHKAQIKASLKINQELILLYWDIGKEIDSIQQETGWGNSILEQVAKDLKKDFPSMGGFSRTNLYYMRQFFLFYRDGNDTNVQQVVGQIPWGHHTVILSKTSNLKEAIFYIRETIKNSWSRNTLGLQIESKLYNRKGKAITNFSKTLPKPQSELVEETLKDPYIFDFLTLEKNFKEKDIEKLLVDNIQNFLIELGKGFAFLGKQYEIEVNNKSYYIDLLFYHVKLRCYIIIELKIGEFQPEYAGKINFYLSAIDDIMKSKLDNPSIGIILCKKKNKIEVEYALRDISKPIGVSEFELLENLPDTLKSSLPTIEEIEKDLQKYAMGAMEELLDNWEVRKSSKKRNKLKIPVKKYLQKVKQRIKKEKKIITKKKAKSKSKKREV